MNWRPRWWGNTSNPLITSTQGSAMKILVTGVTDTHINHPDRAKTTKFMSFPAPLVEGLRMLGHDVEHRAVTAGEDLDQFDKVFCFLYPMDQHARHPDGALHTLRARKDAIIGIDDWAFANIMPTWEPIVGFLRDRLWLAPVFKWGNPKKLGIQADVVGLDPSAMVEIQKVDQWEQRIRSWVHASFHINSHRWVNDQADWPVMAFGCKDLKQARILESTVVKLHGVCAGSMQPPYAHVGAGWWRVRVQHAMENGTVIGCHPDEFCGLSTMLSYPIHRLESLTDDNLRKVAEIQASILRENIGTKHEFLSGLSRLL
jgi:hypothetical protein